MLGPATLRRHSSSIRPAATAIGGLFVWHRAAFSLARVPGGGKLLAASSISGGQSLWSPLVGWGVSIANGGGRTDEVGAHGAWMNARSHATKQGFKVLTDGRRDGNIQNAGALSLPRQEAASAAG